MQGFLVVLLVVAAMLGATHGLTDEEVIALTDMNVTWHPNGWVGDPSCSWPGVSCNGNGNVIELNLTNQQLQGAIPSSIGGLSSLYSLFLGENDLGGPLPSSIGSLSLLVNLDIGSAQIEGPIPSTFSSLTELLSVVLNHNNLNETIPSFQAVHIGYLDLSNNDFSGSIPASLGDLTQLTYLSLYGNNLDGAIPSELCNLDQLEFLYLQQNRLSDVLPDCIGQLSQLQELSVLENSLSGSLPDSLGNLTQLTILTATANMFTGPIPASLGNLQNLQQLRLGENGLSGPIPASLFTNLKKLTYLGLYSNDLSGSLPSSVSNLQQLTYLGLQDNSLSGSLPKELGKLTNLQYLDLQINSFTGSIPSELNGMSSLATLSLQQNQFSGVIPSLYNLTALTSLQLDQNSLTGEIPDWFSNLTQLTVLKLDTNNLTGTIPDIFSSLPNLSTFTAALNNLSGPIPPSVCSVTNIAIFPTNWLLGYTCPLPNCCKFGTTDCSMRNNDAPQICATPITKVFYVNSSAAKEGTGEPDSPFKTIQSAMATLTQTQPGVGVLFSLAGTAPFHPPQGGYSLNPCVSAATIFAAQTPVTIDCQNDLGFITNATGANTCNASGLIFYGISFQNCASAITAGANSYLLASKCNFDGSSQSAIAYSGPGLLLNDVSFNNCTNQNGNGGSVNAPAISLVAYIREITVTNSQATGAGGAIFVNATNSIDQISVNIVRASITKSSAQGQGGAIFAQAQQQVQLSDITTQSTQSGMDCGSLAIISSNDTTMTNVHITNSSSSSGNGGGICAISMTGSAGLQQLCQLTNITASGCSTGGNGGCILVNASIAAVSLIGINITGGTAQGQGGGAWISTNGGITVTDVGVQACSSNGGGGLYLQNFQNQPIILNTSVISGCTAGTVSLNSGGGGGVYISNSASATITVIDLAVVNCNAPLSGGGLAIAATNGLTLLTKIGMQGCSATNGRGGSISVTSSAPVTLSDSWIRLSSATLSGGAIWISPSQSLAITNLTCNTSSTSSTSSTLSSTGNGGCLYITGSSSVALRRQFRL